MKAEAMTARSYAFETRDYPGADSTLLFGTNGRGLVTGAHHVPGGTWHAMTLRDGRFEALDPDGVLGQSRSFALATDERGEIVGQYFSADRKVSHGFVWHQGTVTTVDHPDSSFSAVYGSNASGTRIGIFVDADGALQGYLLDRGTFTTLRAPGFHEIVPYSINARGDIAGRLLDENGLGHGFLRTREGAITLLDHPDFPAGTTTAISLNDHGQVLGFCDLPDGSTHGFLRTRDHWQPIEVPGAAATVPQTLNDAGSIVGYYVDAAGAVHGFTTERRD
jgi:uncharacterized membrane protein